MKVSVNHEDEGHAVFLDAIAKGRRVVVTLDDEEVEFCVSADEEKGVVTRYVLGANGSPKLDPEDQFRICEETLSGNVEITIEDAPGPS